MVWHINQDESLFLKDSQKYAARNKAWKLISLIGAILFITVAFVFYDFLNKAKNLQLEAEASQLEAEKKLAEAGLCELLAPFNESWLLQIKYRTDVEVLERLPDRLKRQVENKSATSNTHKIKSNYESEVSALKKFLNVSGKKSEYALFHLTRRQVYKENIKSGKQQWIWSGYTTKFKFPGTDVKLLLAMLGKTDMKSPDTIDIDFTQYQGYQGQDNSNKKPQNGNVTTSDTQEPVRRYPVTFIKNENNYSGDMKHPILKDIAGNEVTIATMTLRPSATNTQLACE